MSNPCWGPKRQSVKDLRHLHKQQTSSLRFKRKLSKIKSGFNMSFGDKAEQPTYIIFCVELGKSLMETNQLLEKTQSGSSVSRALVYRWHRRFSEDSSAN